MKKIIILLLSAVLPMTAYAASVISYITVVGIETPVPGGHPDKEAMAAYTNNAKKPNENIRVTKVEWTGSFDENGCFVKGRDYRVRVTATIKSGADKYFGRTIKNSVRQTNEKTTINGKKAYVEQASDNEVVLSYNFLNIGAEKRSAARTSAPRTRPAGSSQKPNGTAPRKGLPELTAPPAETTALIEPLGYPEPEDAGMVTSSVSLPPKSESGQMKWMATQKPIPSLNNKSLAAESKALKEWVDNATFTVRDAVATRQEMLDEEFYGRGKALNQFVELLAKSQKELSAAYNEIEAQNNRRALVRVLESAIYKRAIRTDITPLAPYLNKQTLDYFEKKGGLARAVAGKHTVWEHLPKVEVATSEQGVTGTLTDKGTIDVGGMFFRLTPDRAHNRATLYATNAQALKGKDIVIPSHILWEGESYSVEEIQSGAFHSCAMTAVKIPGTVKHIGNNAFANMVKVAKIEIPHSVVELGAAVFHDSPELREVYIPNSVTKIGGGCFANCPKLTVVELPKIVKHFDRGQFENCTSLRTVTLPENLTQIKERMFLNCPNLTQIVIPKGVKTIASMAFNSCTALTSITLPEGLTTIGNWSFSKCTRLRSVVIPSSVTEIGTAAFEGCQSLKSVTLPSRFNDLMVLFGGFGNSGALPQSPTAIPDTFKFVDYNE